MMSISIFAMVAFAVWTHLLLFGSVGIYRWSRILAGQARINEWNPTDVQGSAWYVRAMRAHMNCVENLPIFVAIVLAGSITGTALPGFDILALTVVISRIAHSLVYVAFEQTERIASLRFALFFLQAISMLGMAAMIFLRLGSE